MLRYLKRLRHVNLDASAAPWRKDNIFRIFRVWHANQGRTKYDVYSIYHNSKGRHEVSLTKLVIVQLVCDSLNVGDAQPP